jgi:hypothetical protein
MTSDKNKKNNKVVITTTFFGSRLRPNGEMIQQEIDQIKFSGFQKTGNKNYGSFTCLNSVGVNLL